jgi:hypothetical protein
MAEPLLPPLGPMRPVNAGGPGIPARPVGQQIKGRPNQPLPGALNGRQARQFRTPVAPTIPQGPKPDPAMQCLIEYLCNCIVGKLTTQMLWLPQTARRPSHIDVPFGGQKFHRHRGTGVTTDPPVALPPVGPGGPFTEILDFQVPDLARGVISFWGFDVNPTNTLRNIDVRILINNRPINIMGTEYGNVVPASAGFWEGAPFGIATPNRDICEHLSRRDRVSFQMRNTTVIAPVEVSAVMGGHIYFPTADSGENSIYGTMTDNPQRYGAS